MDLIVWMPLGNVPTMSMATMRKEVKKTKKGRDIEPAELN
jgi:hypothetical protein